MLVEGSLGEGGKGGMRVSLPNHEYRVLQTSRNLVCYRYNFSMYCYGRNPMAKKSQNLATKWESYNSLLLTRVLEL